MVTRLCLALVAALAAIGTTTGQPKAALSPDGSEVLAEGPLKIDIVVTETTALKEFKTTRDKGVLLFVTRDGLYYRDAKTGKLQVKLAKSVTTARVETEAPVARADGTKGAARWTFDAGTGAAFGGDRLAPRVPDLAPLPGTKVAEQNWFLYRALVRLQARVDAAVFVGDKLQLEFYLRHADELAAYTARNDYDRAVADAYKGFAAYVREQRDASEALDRLYAEQVAVRQELIRLARQAEARRQTANLVNGLNLLFSALPSYEEVTLSDGTTARVDTGPDVGGVFGALGGIYQTQAAYRAEMSRLAVAKQAFDAETQEKYAELHKKLTGSRADRADLLRRIGVDRFRLAKVSPSDRLPEVQAAAVKQKDPKPVLALFEEQVKYDRGAGPWDNPFALCDLYETTARSLPPGPARADELFALAERAAAAVRLVPPGEVFAYERMEVLRVAVRLACLAAAADAGDGFWCRAFSPRAAYAVRLVDRMGALDRLDVSGEVREQRAVALLLVGRVPEALDQALKIGELRKTSATYHYTLARLYSVRSFDPEVRALPAKDRPRYGKMALDSLREAFKFGFSDLRELKEEMRDGDFCGLFSDPESRAAVPALLRPAVTYSVPDLQGRDGRIVVSVVNRSEFTLTNVTGRLDPKGRPGEALKFVPAGARIRPGQEVRFEVELPKGKPFNFANWGLTMSSDQAKALPAKYAP
ncbi:MAG: hypothetical protein J0I06_09195 [Planctomycetes bacterium]|nr:hypothetical protein [Planctomycetota bacterium]